MICKTRLRRTALLLALLGPGCTASVSDPPPLMAEVPLHLEEHVDAATIVGSEIPTDGFDPVEWRFDRPRPEWNPAQPMVAGFDAVTPIYLDGVLRLPLTGANRRPDNGRLLGSIYVELPGWRPAEWSVVEIRARTSDRMRSIGIDLNHSTDDSYSDVLPFATGAEWAPLVTDGTVRTYRLPLEHRIGTPPWDRPWTHLGIWFNTPDGTEAATLDILSVRILSREAIYANAPVGVRTEVRGIAHRRTLYMHAPGRLEYRLRVPDAGRLDLGLGVLRRDAPVSFRITAERRGGAIDTLLQETYADSERWAQRTVDLSELAGETVTLALHADAEIPGTVAQWATPTVSGVRTVDKPNVILYILDGGGAEHMSVYGYNRRTTPNLDRLATEGAVFEGAYSNSSWSTPSTSSFTTSLHHSVLGGVDDFEPMPPQAVTMAQHLHTAGYQTAVLTTNAYAGSLSSLDRGVDVLREAGARPDAVSSVELHGDYWNWRQAYPGEPYWVHFQTTDVHRGDTEPGAPFAGLFINPERRERSRDRQRRLEENGQQFAHLPSPATLMELGIDPEVFYQARRDIYDEGMAHQDYQLGQLTKQLQAAGEWENTLLIVAADHGPWHAGLRDPLAEADRPMFQSTIARIPMIVVWPGRIAAGQRFSEPVSMIDVLPTILDLVDLPMPELMQGQSLAPLLLGEAGWQPRPVILDEFYRDSETGELRGVIEVVDGRWGASLQINPAPDTEPVPMLLFDLWNDPYCRVSLHEERPDLVERYTVFLEEQFEAHQLLAARFTQGAQGGLTPEQLRTLRALGYIQ